MSPSLHRIVRIEKVGFIVNSASTIYISSIILVTDDGQRRSERARTATFYPDYYNSNCGSGCWRTGGNSFTDFFFFIQWTRIRCVRSWIYQPRRRVRTNERECILKITDGVWPSSSFLRFERIESVFREWEREREGKKKRKRKESKEDENSFEEWTTNWWEARKRRGTTLSIEPLVNPTVPLRVGWGNWNNSILDVSYIYIKGIIKSNMHVKFFQDSKRNYSYGYEKLLLYIGS